MSQLSPFRLMNTLFLGLAMSVLYGVAGAAIVFFKAGQADSQLFFVAYTSSFRTLLSLGLILGTALIVYRSQEAIPATIEEAFTNSQLRKTDYVLYKQRFMSRRRSMTFAANFVIVAFIIFAYAQFPLSRDAEILMLIAACTQYALGVYVGRKLFYAGMMLQSLLSIPVTRNLFKERSLDNINSYVNIASTLTIIFVYVHVTGYYEGPFLYKSILGISIRPFLLLPAIIAAPVLLIFNFYPRAVLRRIYDQSIELEVKALQKTLQSESLSAYEKRSHVIEFEQMSREELRYTLQLTLSDLPIGITILIMVLEPILSK